MKKIFISTIAVLLGFFLQAQVSVWDGSIEPFDNSHAGTESDPVLIENAAQLAYLTQYSCEWDIMYYKLMTDIDLAGLEWQPIGYSPAANCGFKGYFDGNNNTIYHLTTTLFWWMDDGYIKNLTIRDSEILIQHGLNAFGGIVHSAPLVENCHNYGDVILDYDEGYLVLSWSMGGIAGECNTIRNCSNHGKMKVVAKSPIGLLSIGGVAGIAVNVEESYNTGWFIIDSEVYKCRVGGLCGEITGEVSNCYNIADLMIGKENSFAGGIAGNAHHYQQDTVTINSCYNSGNIVASTVGGIVAEVMAGVAVDAGSSYYINTVDSGNEYGIAKSEDEMKTQSFVDLLNNGSNVYAMDEINANHGYPIFAQYYFVMEHKVYDNISFYPNPAQNTVNITFSDDIDGQSVEIYSIDGRIVDRHGRASLQTAIDISDLNPGVYILKVNMADGREFTERIVKE